MNPIFVDVDLFNLCFANLLRDGVFFTHVNVGYVNKSELVSHEEQFLFLVPANGSVEHLVRVTDAEDVLLLAYSFDCLVIPDGEGARLLCNVEDLYQTIPVHSPLFVFKLEFTFLPPLFGSFELEEGSFRVSGIDPKSLSIVDLQTVDPDVYIKGLVD